MTLKDEIDKIDAQDSRLFPTEQTGFANAKDKCTRYLREGKEQHAEGGVEVMKIMHSAALDDLPESFWGDL